MLAPSLLRRSLLCQPARRFYGSVARPAVSATHEVMNQSQELRGYNMFSNDLIMSDALENFGGGWAKEQLTRHGEEAGSDQAYDLAFKAHINTPILHTHDKFGNQVYRAEFHPAYHYFMDMGIRNKVPSFAWVNEGKESAHVARAVMNMNQYAAEPGTSCPLTMTYAVIPCLEGREYVSDWYQKAISDKYDPSDAPISEKKGITLGMSMTEKQGGSDIRRNTTTAKPLTAQTGEGQQYSLKGHKWFTSAPMSDAFLTLARTTDDSISCFLVPRWLPDGTRNIGFKVMRLKNKVGDRSNASSEVEYDGAWGLMIGSEGKGVQTIIEMVTLTRLDCTLGSASLVRNGVSNAINWTHHREAFGNVIGKQPLMQNVLADLALEAEAAQLLALRIAKSFDDKLMFPDDENIAKFSRIATAVAKYYVCKKAANASVEAMECHGGNGFVEDNVTARMYRQAPLNSIWEGSGNVISLDILRSIHKTPGVIESLFNDSDVQEGVQKDKAFATYVAGTSKWIKSVAPERMEISARQLASKLALMLQGALMLKYAPAINAEAFIASRMANTHSGLYGGLDISASDMQSIVERAAIQV
eukprot:Clim_evm13s246 gene=Clim_evmTU13s246